MTVAGSVRSKVSRAEPGTLFSVEEFSGSRGAVETALSRLEDGSELLRIRKGLYFKGVRSRFGPGRPRAEDVAYKICGTKGVGPTGWTASRVLGLSTQLPARSEFALVGAPPTNVPGVRFHTRRNLSRLSLNPHEIAVLEILRSWPTHSDLAWNDFVERMAALRDEGEIRPDRLARVADRERSPNLRERAHALASALEAART